MNWSLPDADRHNIPPTQKEDYHGEIFQKVRSRLTAFENQNMNR
ncbi:hypothetical protein [Cyclobacterium sp.]|nr:hypothetical protein [Cyclobacterium sp.]